MVDKTALELAADQTRRTCSLDHFDFETTEELAFTQAIIGQPRGVRAIEFGIDIDTPGFNIFALGPAGTGRATAIRRFLESRAQEGKVPQDWVYVHNFEVEHQPRAIGLPSGLGIKFRDDMQALIGYLRDDIPAALEANEFMDAVQALVRDFDARRDAIMKAVLAEAQAHGFTIARSPSGLIIAPVDERKQLIPPEQLERLDKETFAALEAKHEELGRKLAEALREVRALDREQRQEERRLSREAAAFVVDQHIGDIRERYADHEEVLLYLNQVREDVLDHLEDFRREEGEEEAKEAPKVPGIPPPDRFRRYAVNPLIDHSRTKGAPVVVEDLPSYASLVGRIEGEVRMGALRTDFTMIKPGALHRANGGYLVLRVASLFSRPGAWEGLKRALRNNEIRIEESMVSSGLGVLTPQTIEPEPIPLNVKVILLGSPSQYYLLYQAEEEFSELFKTKADFADRMDRSPDTEREYAAFIAARCQEDCLPHFSRAAVGQMVEYGSRLAGDQDKLSTLFGHLYEVIQEAAYWARHDGKNVVEAKHVIQAIEERRYRANLYEEGVYESIRKGRVFIDTVGQVVGQVNGLSIVGLGDYAFGQPTRITARIYAGKEGVVNIEREVKLSGPIHNKGVLTLQGYLGGQYALEQPLTLTASITFEQTYSGVEGDSASSAELYALLSALSGYAIEQSLAVTGSVDQYGRIQPVDGVTEKVEGFFRACRMRELTGSQGVLIPKANIPNLMLSPEVVEAIRAGQFHIYAVETVEQGIELLTGIPAGERQPDGTYPEGTVHRAVQERLRELAERVKSRGEETV